MRYKCSTHTNPKRVIFDTGDSKTKMTLNVSKAVIFRNAFLFKFV
jgi:hypothetical protein